jgi:beta-mannosidase
VISLILSLNGKWQVYDDEGKYSFVGNVPGTVQEDLIVQKLIPHPYVGLNEKYMKDLENKSWTYIKEFELDDLPAEENVELVFEGIDTLSDIYLNGKYLGNTEDMFLEYRFNIKDVLKKGKNVLKLNIKSPVKEPKTLEQMYSKIGATEESIRPYIRKAQYSYGWDWGARLVTSGIWRPVYIESYYKARLTGCTAYLEEMSDRNGIIRVTGYVISAASVEDPQNYRVEVRLNDEITSEFPVEHVGRQLKCDGALFLENIRLWFPNGLGEQYLYTFEFKLKYKDNGVYSEKKKIGLRTIKLIKEKDSEGESFIFAINGKQVFAKGANWIPADNILTWIKPEDYKKLLYMAKEANMNMLRVWGGGIYEDEQFYTLCDELGIMVWQDFMFACAEYPDHLEWFRKLGNKEVREIVRELRYHASIVLWCGNNENNWGFEEWLFMKNKVNGEHLGNKLYLHDFPMICAQEDPSRPYWPSSPFGGDKANSAEYGDCHVWNVWSGWVDYKAYANENGRFISEFGFQSAPDPKTIDFFAKKEEQDIFHPVILNHNKQVEGQERIIRYINSHFGLIKEFDTFVYLSQLNQAEAIKFGVEHWRARKYRTAGTLYWQYNDSWPVFSWSSVDYFKRPKALYYYTKKFYADILLIAQYEPSEQSIRVMVVNDQYEDKIVNILLEIWDTEGKKIWEKKYKGIRILKDFVSAIDIVNIDGIPMKITSDMVMYISAQCDEQEYDNYFLFNDFKNMHLVDPELSYVREGDNLVFQCKKPAFGVYIDTEEECILSDNYFTLVPSSNKRIRCFSNKIKVKSLYNYLNKKFKKEGTS